MARAQSIIGAGVGRVEGAEKVSGQAVYAADVHLPDALWAKILRSPYPHARIVNIDTSKASKVDGVKAIVTGKEEPNHYQGKSIRDIPCLCWDKVRFIGDRVAAVAAETLDAAEEALNLIEEGFREADLIIEHTFRIPIHHQGYLEPQASLVKIEDDGQVFAWSSTKGPFGTRSQFAKAI